jgi:imidazolonepropionase-like amidohydrolase
VLIGAAELARLRALPELRYMPPAVVEAWTRTHENRLQAVDPIAARRHAQIRNQLLAALNDGGVTILLGSDAPQQFSVPGFAIHNEMEAMVRAGLSAYDVLRSGTVEVARHLGTVEDAGRIAVGHAADLVLLEANPLDDIGNVRRQAGVMIRGVWLPASEIRRRLDAIAASY